MTPAHMAEQKPRSSAESEALGMELAAIRERIRAELGERDASYIRRIVALQRTLEAS